MVFYKGIKRAYSHIDCKILGNFLLMTQDDMVQCGSVKKIIVTRTNAFTKEVKKLHSKISK